MFAREKFFNTKQKWYSFKPIEYQNLKDKNPLEQVAGQTLLIRKTIDEGLEKVPGSNKLSVQYDDFCNNPLQTMQKLKEKFNALGFNLDIDQVDEKLFKPFSVNNSNRLNISDTKELQMYIEKYSSK